MQQGNFSAKKFSSPDPHKHCPLAIDPGNLQGISRESGSFITNASAGGGLPQPRRPGPNPLGKEQPILVLTVGSHRFRDGGELPSSLQNERRVSANQSHLDNHQCRPNCFCDEVCPARSAQPARSQFLRRQQPRRVTSTARQQDRGSSRPGERPPGSLFEVAPPRSPR